MLLVAVVFVAIFLGCVRPQSDQKAIQRLGRRASLGSLDLGKIRSKPTALALN